MQWDQAKEGVIRDNWERLSDLQIGLILGATRAAVQRRRLDLGLKRPRTEFYYDQGKKCLCRIPNVIWTEDDDNFLKAHYRGYTDRDLSFILDRSIHYIRGRRFQLRLPKRRKLSGETR